MTRNSENNSLTGSWVTLNHLGTAGLTVYDNAPAPPFWPLPPNGCDVTALPPPSFVAPYPVSCLKKSGPLRASHPLLPPAPAGLANVRVRRRRQVIVVRSAPRTPPNTPTVSEPAMPSPAREDALPRSRSWVSVERLLLEAQKEREKSGSSVGSSFMDRDPRGTGLEDTPNASAWSSPMYPASPYPEWRTDVKDELKNTDWIWDWSVRVTSDMHGDDLSDHVVGPCSLVDDGVRRKLSLRNSPVMKTVLLSPRIIPWLLFTNVFSLLLGAGIGLYFGIQWYTSPPALSPPPLYRRF